MTLESEDRPKEPTASSLALLSGICALVLVLLFAALGMAVAILALILARRGEASMPPGSLSPQAVVGRWLAVLAVVVGIVSISLAFQEYYPSRLPS